MTKLAKTTVFTATAPQKETVLDKTARVVREIQDWEKGTKPSQDNSPSQCPS